MRNEVKLANPNYDSSKIEEFKNVWVFCEQRQGQMMSTSYELISEGRKLADELGVKLCGLIVGDQIGGLAESVGGYGADEGIANEVASALRKICSKRAFSLELCQADSSLGALGDILLIAIISNNADLEIINHRLSLLRQSGIDTLIFTTEGISSELCIDDGIVTVSDSIALFNPVTLASSVYQTAVLNVESDTKNDLSA